MFKRVLICVLVFVAPRLVSGQSPELIVQGVSPDMYVLHTVAPKENWYSVGRLFNLSPKEIAPVNGKTLTTPLNIGEQLKVPLTPANFSQNNTKAGDEVFVPVYHIVQDKEWMFRISSNYNKVPVENLEKWNNLGKDGAKTGSKLIIGFLKVKKDQGVAGTVQPAAPVTQNPVANAPVQSAPVTNPPTNGQAQQTPVTNTTSSAPVTKAPATNPPANGQVTKPQVTQPVTAAEQKSADASPKATLPAATPASSQTSVPGDSYFKNLYEPTGKSANGYAGVFKSMSGWQDKKFYALMSGVSVGTIVRVSNPTTGKFVFAKVLGQIPDMKESAGLLLRLSDAAASELGAVVTKFGVQVAY